MRVPPVTIDVGPSTRIHGSLSELHDHKENV